MADSLLQILLLAALSFFLITACSSGGGDDGIDGTGTKPEVPLAGTAAIGRPIAKATVSVKDKEGTRRNAETDDHGKYELEAKDLVAPYIVKVNVEGSDPFYSIAYRPGTANVHPFTNIVLRNWVSVRGRNIDEEFEENGAFNDAPAIEQIEAIVQVIEGLLSIAYQEFGLSTDFDFIETPFDADHTGFDRLLDHVKVIFTKNKIIIKITNPRTGMASGIQGWDRIFWTCRRTFSSRSPNAWKQAGETAAAPED